MNTWLRFFRRYFEHRSYQQIPLAIGVGPAIQELTPGVAQWYLSRAIPQHEFFCDVSGAGYIQPPHFGLAYQDSKAVWKGFLGWTARLMHPLGLRTLRPMEGDDRQLARYAAALPFCHSILADMGRYYGHQGQAQLNYTLPGDLPVFRAATSWRKHPEGLLGEIREQTGATRPAFVNSFVTAGPTAPKSWSAWSLTPTRT